MVPGTRGTLTEGERGDTSLITRKPVHFFASVLLVHLLFQSSAFALPLPAPVPVSLASCTYDGEGKRITSTEGGVTTTYLYDGLLPVVERLNGTGFRGDT